MKVCICIPAQDMLHTTFFNSCVQMMFYSRNKGIEITVTQMNGCYLDLLRNQLVQSALKQNPDYILFLDSDMTFPHDTLERLLKEEKQIIGCNYMRRRPPHDGIACTFADPNKRVDPLAAVGIERVALLPTGVMLIKKEVFDLIPYPWFQTIWRKSDKKLIGEDIFFCASAGDNKIPIYCDHDLSKQVAHSGQFDYSFGLLAE